MPEPREELEACRRELAALSGPALVHLAEELGWDHAEAERLRLADALSAVVAGGSSVEWAVYRAVVGLSAASSPQTEGKSPLRAIGAWDAVPVAVLMEACARAPLVGRIVDEQGAGSGERVGTGTAIGGGWILTAAHVVEGASAAGRVEFLGRTPSTSARWTAADVLLLDGLDVAFLQLPGEDPAVPGPALSRTPALPEVVHLLHHGAPAGALVASVSHNRVVRHDAARLLYEADTERGTSGAALWSGSWELVGIHLGTADGYNRGLRLDPIVAALARSGDARAASVLARFG